MENGTTPGSTICIISPNLFSVMINEVFSGVNQSVNWKRGRNEAIRKVEAWRLSGGSDFQQEKQKQSFSQKGKSKIILI